MSCERTTRTSRIGPRHCRCSSRRRPVGSRLGDRRDSIARDGRRRWKGRKVANFRWYRHTGKCRRLARLSVLRGRSITADQPGPNGALSGILER